jgi:hypothetical protein
MSLHDPGNELAELGLTGWQSQVTDRVAAPSAPGPELLPFHERSWADFEKIILIVAEHVDGMRGVRIYGTPGQSQDGIDLYGTDADGKNVAYQAKRHVSFNENALAKAVTKFAAGDRPVNAKKLVICVACETDRTQMSEKLEKLRAEHAIEIELYDRRRLSESLKARPDLVRRLFGSEWAAAFCDGVDWPVPERAPSDVLADALVRGPVTALGLEANLNRCDALASTDPAAAAAELVPIIDALNRSGFSGFAERLKYQHAELLVSAGDLHAGIDSLSTLAWEHIEAGGAHWDRHAVGRVRALIKDNNVPAANAFIAFADAIDDWYGQPARGLTLLADRHQQLADLAHPLADAATLWLIETALAIRDADRASQLAAQVDDIVDRRAPFGLADPVTVRLRTAKADVDGNWDALLRDARAGRVGSTMATVVHGRFGRHCARHSLPEDAEAEYSLAIQRACTAGLTSEAAACVRSIIQLRARFGHLSDDMHALSQLALSVEASGSIGLFPGRDPLDAGAVALANGELPEALRWYRTALRSAVIRGDLNDEHTAQLALVDVLNRSGEGHAALQHALAAGSTDDAEKCMPLDAYTHLRNRLTIGPHWERATALRAVSLQADLIPDDEIAPHIDIALAATQEPQRSFFAPHVHLNAWKVLAALIERSTRAQAVEALDQLEERIDREPNQYRFEDDDHIAIVVDIARSQPTLQERAAIHLARIIGQGDHFADAARSAILQNLDPPHPLLIERLTALADSGHASALQTIGDLDIAHPDLTGAVQAAVDATLSAPEPPAGTMYFGTALPRVARGARILDEEQRRRVAEHCLNLAQNTGRPESNRTEGVEGVLLLARHLPDELREELFPKVIELVHTGGIPTDVDRPLLGGLHPLSTMRIDLDFGSLPREALQTAAVLALTPDHAADVVALAMERLVSREEKDVYAAAKAISYLKPEHVDLDVRLLVAHPVAWVRQLAAALAVHRNSPSADVIMQLAQDPDPSVRRTLASGISVLAANDRGLSEQLAEVLASDSHWSVRHLATASVTGKEML